MQRCEPVKWAMARGSGVREGRREEGGMVEAFEPRREQPQQELSYSLHFFWNFPLHLARLSVTLTSDCLWRSLPAMLLSGVST
jgi:hypothetical protein